MMSIKIKKTLTVVTVTVVLLLITISDIQRQAVAENGGLYFGFLQEKLIKEGFARHIIVSLYKRPEICFDFKGVARYFEHREAKLNYEQFTSKRSINQAKKYMKQYSKELLKAERIYGVDKEIIVAILLVETRLGKVTGNKSILNTLSTLASLSTLNIREIVWNNNLNSFGLKREEFDKWGKRKSQWAYTELKAFLQYVKREGIDPVNIYGSFAGALGIAQFMPSSIIAFAQDGDCDGSIDLFNHSDSISSVAKYLSHYGWHPGIDRKIAYQVVYRYNHSKYYVNTVLKIAHLLKG